MPQGDRVGEVLEADAVLEQAWYRERPRGRAERDDEPLVARLRARRRATPRRSPCLAIVARDAAEDELGVRAHLAQWDDDVAGLERSRAASGRSGV